MSKIKRFGVSLPSDLLEKFDELIEEKGYGNRSKAIADIIREQLVQASWEYGKGEVVGVITMIYDHHTSNVVTELLEIQHGVETGMYSTMHIHLDHHNCLEILAMKGDPTEIKKMADRLGAIRGVKHTGLVMADHKI